MQILCACGCNELFERKPETRQVVKDEHRHEYRKKMELERWHRNKPLREAAKAEKKAQKPGPQLYDVKCPADGEIYQMPFEIPPAVMPRIYCTKHEYHRTRTADNSIFAGW